MTVAGFPGLIGAVVLPARKTAYSTLCPEIRYAYASYQSEEKTNSTIYECAIGYSHSRRIQFAIRMLYGNLSRLIFLISVLDKDPATLDTA